MNARRSHFPASRRGFTLIELLVVIGIIAVLAGAIGIGLRGGDQTVALQGGQGTLNAMISATRGRAAIAGEDARLLVNADATDADVYLRQLAVAVDDGTGTFTVAGEPISLPQGVYVVPPSSVPVANGVTWPATLVSGLLQGPVSISDQMGVSGSWLYLNMTKFGSTVNVSDPNIVLSTADRTETGIEFNNPNNVRGLTVSQYGAVTLIDDATGFQ